MFGIGGMSALESIFAPFSVRGKPFLTDGDLYPGVVTTFEANADSTVWTLTIRDDVLFHNGEPMTAEDVAFSLNTVSGPDYEGSNSAGYFASIDEAVVVDDTTVEVRMTEPNPAFYDTSPRLYVFPKAYYEEVGQAGMAAAPISAGPYKFVEWRPDDELVLEAFDDYYEGPPAIKEVIFRVIPDEAARAAALQAGEVDIATLSAEQAEVVASDSDINIVAKDSLTRAILGIDNFVPPFDQPEVRMAVSHAIDRQIIIDQILGGTQRQLAGLLLPGLEPGANTDLEPYAYDPERSRELLAEAGYPDGLGPQFGPTDFACWDFMIRMEDICTVIADMLEQVGIPVTPEVVEYNTYLDRARQGTLPPLRIVSQSGGGNFSGIYTLRSQFACREGVPGHEVTTPLQGHPILAGAYCDPAFDAVLWDAFQTRGPDPEGALELVAEAEAIAHAAAAAAFLWENTETYAIRAGLNWEPPAERSINLFEASWS